MKIWYSNDVFFYKMKIYKLPPNKLLKNKKESDEETRKTKEDEAIKTKD